METVFVEVSELEEFVEKAAGEVYIVGDAGGFSLVNGEISRSSLIPGTLLVELDVGAVHLPLEEEQEVVVVEGKERLIFEDTLKMDEVVSAARLYLEQLYNIQAEVEDDGGTKEMLAEYQASIDALEKALG